jgi:multiple sugar transport system substrate-binding protein
MFEDNCHDKTGAATSAGHTKGRDTMIRTLLAAASLSLLASTSSFAACAFQNTTPIKVQAASFAAWRVATAAMQECGNVQVELDLQYRDKQPAALKAQPSLYHIAGLAPNTLVPLLNDGTVRPLDDLIAKFGQQLQPNQQIKIDGRTMAIAMMINVQHLMVREDILKQLNIVPPATYDDVLKAADAIKKSGLVQYPLGGTYKSGWDLATEFINLFHGYGGRFIGANNAPSVNGEAGKKTLEMMKALTAYMDPEFLVSDATFVQKQFQQGKIAMANLWSSRAGAMDNAAESTVVGKIAMSAAPAAMAGGKPATTVFWDGFSIAKNIPDAEAEMAFRIAMEGIDEEMVKANNGAAVWLIKGYEVTRLAQGAIASAQAGAPGYPATTAMGFMHTSLGENVADYLTGRKTAEQTLVAIETAYTTRAREAGLIK